MKTGFIGLGSLGTPLALNLLERGHELFVYNRTGSKTIPLAERGAIVCETPGDVARQASIVFTLVSDDAALNQICNGENGLLRNMNPGSIHVSLSTILPQTAGELALLHQLRNQHYLAAPVFGRPEAAAARKINIVISGEEKIRNSVEPFLKDAGALGVWHFGEAMTAANTVKLCGNFLIAGAMEAIGESIRLAGESGVDARLMWNMFTQTILNAPVYHTYSNIILNQQYEPAAFTARLGLKDLNLVIQQASLVKQSLPLAGLLRNHLQQLVNTGQGEIDWSALSTAVDKNS